MFGGVDRFSPTGMALTVQTVRIALVLYFACLFVLLRMDGNDWACRTARGRLARRLWTWGLIFFLAHVACAFHFVHDWSHADAFARTALQGGVGEGIYLNYLFALVWCADVAFWQVLPIRYAARPSWTAFAMHGFMLFMVFNASVVFAVGLTRYVAVALFAALIIRATSRSAHAFRLQRGGRS